MNPNPKHMTVKEEDATLKQLAILLYNRYHKQKMTLPIKNQKPDNLMTAEDL
jgi:hypothetical protein